MMAVGRNKIICLTIESSLFHLPTAINLLKFPASFVRQLSSHLCYWFPYVSTSGLEVHLHTVKFFSFFFFFPCCQENDFVHVVNLLSLFTTRDHPLPDVFVSSCQWSSPVWNWHPSLPHTERSMCWKVSSSVRKTQLIFHVSGICCPTIRLLS